MPDLLFQTPVESCAPVRGSTGHTTTPADRRRKTYPAGVVLTFIVHGQSAPQGSKRGYVVNGRAVLVESSKRVQPWREAVKAAALDALTRSDWQPARNAALMLTVVYTLPRPKSHYRTGRNAHLLRDNAPKWPTGKPDAGKLTRATEDALTDCGVYGDDAQIVVSLSVKSYPDVHPHAMTSPGAYVRVSVLPPDSSRER